MGSVLSPYTMVSSFELTLLSPLSSDIHLLQKIYNDVIACTREGGGLVKFITLRANALYGWSLIDGEIGRIYKEEVEL